MSVKGMARERSHYSAECVVCNERVEVTTLDEFRRCHWCRKQLLAGSMSSIEMEREAVPCDRCGIASGAWPNVACMCFEEEA